MITISHVAVCCGGLKFPPADFAVWRRIGFYRIASVRVLQNREFIRHDGIFGDGEFCGSSRRLARPRNFYLSLLLLPQLFLWIARTSIKWENSHGYLRRVIQKLPAVLCSLLFSPLKKTSRHDILLHRTYFTISRTSWSAQRDQSKSRLINSFLLSANKREVFLETFAEKIMCFHIADS